MKCQHHSKSKQKQRQKVPCSGAAQQHNIVASVWYCICCKGYWFSMRFHVLVSVMPTCSWPWLLAMLLVMLGKVSTVLLSAAQRAWRASAQHALLRGMLHATRAVLAAWNVRRAQFTALRVQLALRKKVRGCVAWNLAVHAPARVCAVQRAAPAAQRTSARKGLFRPAGTLFDLCEWGKSSKAHCLICIGCAAIGPCLCDLLAAPNGHGDSCCAFLAGFDLQQEHMNRDQSLACLEAKLAACRVVVKRLR